MPFHGNPECFRDGKADFVHISFTIPISWHAWIYFMATGFPTNSKACWGGGTSVNRTGDVAGFLNIFNSTFCLLQLNNCKILEIVKHYAVLLRLASANCRKTPAMQLKNFAHWYYFKRL